VLAVARRRLSIGLLLVVTVLGLGACRTPKDDNIAKAIGIQEFAFNPVPYEAEPGEDIEVVNLDSVTHTLTADDGSMTTGRVKSRATSKITVEQAGVIAYHCEIHDFMRGIIRVTEQG
jgi:plastocyanin